VKVELTCLAATGEILGNQSIEVTAREGCLYVDRPVLVRITLAGKLERTALYLPDLDAHVYIQHGGAPVKAGDDLTLAPEDNRLLALRFA
jgi:hypothetical protein